MSLSSRAARAGGAALLGAALALSAGCSAGKAAQTANERSSVEGGSGDIGPLALRDVLVGYPAVGRYQAGQSAPLEFDVASSSLTDDTLIAIHTPAAASVLVTAQPASSAQPTSSQPTDSAQPSPATASPAPSTATPSTAGSSTAASGSTGAEPASQPITVPAGSLASFGRGDGPQAILLNLTQPLQPGQNVSVTFVFAKAGSVTVVVPVSASDSALPVPSPIVSSIEP